jgi:hypothetical protein
VIQTISCAYPFIYPTFSFLSNFLFIGTNGEPRSSFGAAAKEHEKFFYNDAVFLLAMAIADGALFSYKSIEYVQKQETPQGEDELILRFNESALDRPILRKCTKTDGVTSELMPKGAFIAVFQSTLNNVGYFWGPSIHVIRRQLGKGVDSKFFPGCQSDLLACGFTLL